ncbi:FAD/NAD(P)-binding protein, partial [Caballeronia sp.]|uniref:FAD/NAD(P)-binding protein n=1 Tax=Caballeronia sp. TaxID=1931223 RepID=UPI003C542D1E
MSFASTANGTTNGATGLKVVVIGGGFTGVAFIIHAIRAAHPGVGLDFTIVEPTAQLGRGVAYGTDEPLHRINVPSDRMSLFAGDPGHATRWLAAHGAIDAGSADARGHYYVSRARYGEYVAATLKEVVANAAPQVRVVHRRATATGVQKSGSGYVVQLADGAQIDADRVALCFGHTPSKPPGVIDADVFDDDRFVTHPWSADALRAIAPDACVLLVGTGLTMADVAVTLLDRGHRGRITAISRRGLRPRPHGVFADSGDFLGDAPAPRTARGLLRMLRERIATDELGLGWHAAADAFRFQLPALWNALPPIEKRRVVARLLPFWDVHRFRIAPQIHDTVEKAIASGQMSVMKAGIADISRSASGFRAGLRLAGGGREE